MIKTLHDTVSLTNLTVLSVSGPDAASFLQSQFTQDMSNADPQRALLAAYCSPRGRVLATMVVVPPAEADNAFLLLVRTDIADTLAKRLRMFVLRADVQVEQLDWQVTGGWHHAPRDTDAWHVTRTHSACRITAPDGAQADISRYWVLASEATESRPDTTALQKWHADDMAAGLPWVGADNQEVYLAQTLNLDLLGAVSFTKGCYPGQEVIARSHYRGVVKRRTAYGVVAPDQDTSLPEPTTLVGTDTWNAAAPKSPCGRVINAAQTESGLHVLIEVQLRDLPDADFRLGQADGPGIRLQPLPYDIVEPSDDESSD